MATVTARKVEPRDWLVIRDRINRDFDRVAKKGGKLWTSLVDLDKVLHTCIYSPNAYIVEESFLVVYDVAVPWYTKSKVLEEVIVLRLVYGDFQNVPKFLEQEAQRHGCDYLAVGTALAISDRALCRMYSKSNLVPEATTLGKLIK